MIFSDGLDVDKIEELHHEFSGRCRVSFGWGTLLTNDFRGLTPGDTLAPFSVVCKAFRDHSVTVGKDAQGEVAVEVEYQNRLFRGRGVSTDSVEASAKAFLNAINRIASTENGGSGVKE